MSDDDILIAPDGYVPMPLAEAQVGDTWFFRGEAKFANGATPQGGYVHDDARVLVTIVEVGPGYVVEETSIGSSIHPDWSYWTPGSYPRGYDIIDYMPPGRGWTRHPDDDDQPQYRYGRPHTKATHWRRRRTWVAE